MTRRLTAGSSETEGGPGPSVTLTDFDPEGETKVAAAALYATSRISDAALLDRARRMTVEERAAVLRAYAGDRRNRRHKPGRAFERTGYRFDIQCDYGAFRDLQRHRMLTIEWQRLSTDTGYDVPSDVAEAGAAADWRHVMERSAALARAIEDAGLEGIAQYAVAMAYRIRFVMQMNAREAMHLVELRSSPQGHPAYRWVAQEMHRLVSEEAGHTAIAAAMGFVDHTDIDLERLDAERRVDAKRRAMASTVPSGDGPSA